MEKTRCAMAAWFSRLRPAQTPPPDRWPRLLGATAFLRRGNWLRQATRRRGEMLTLAVLEGAGIEQVEAVHGAALAATVRRALAGKLLAAAGPRGLAAATEGNAFALLLPGVDEDGAMALVKRELGDPLELVVCDRTAGGDMVRVVCRPVCLVRLLDAHAGDLVVWLDDMHEDMALARRWRGDRDALAAAVTRAMQRSEWR